MSSMILLPDQGAILFFSLLLGTNLTECEVGVRIVIEKNWFEFQQGRWQTHLSFTVPVFVEDKSTGSLLVQPPKGRTTVEPPP